MFNKWASCNALSKLLELNLCSLIFDLPLGFNLSMITASLKPLSQIVVLAADGSSAALSSSTEYESFAIDVLSSSSGGLSASLLDEELLSELF